MRILEVEIKNWNKFNPRTDVKSCTWFRMSNDFFNDPEFYGFTIEARMIWIFLLCTASKKMTSKIKINTQMIADNLGVRVESIDFALEALLKVGCLTAPDARVIPMGCGPTVKTKLLSDYGPYITDITDITNEQDITNKPEKNLSEIQPQDFRNSKDSALSPSDVIALLNSICFKSFRVTPAHSKHIAARISEGFTLEDFAAVIRFKFGQWSNDPKFAAYLRPETLFGTKMDSYLQESKNAFKTKLTPTAENPTADPYLEQLNQIRRSGEIA